MELDTIASSLNKKLPITGPKLKKKYKNKINRNEMQLASTSHIIFWLHYLQKKFYLPPNADFNVFNGCRNFSLQPLYAHLTVPSVPAFGPTFPQTFTFKHLGHSAN